MGKQWYLLIFFIKFFEIYPQNVSYKMTQGYIYLSDQNLSLMKNVLNLNDSLLYLHNNYSDISKKPKSWKNPHIENIQSVCQNFSDLLNTFKNNSFQVRCLGRARKIAYKRWLYYQTIDPEHKLFIKYDLPDSSDLIYAYKKRLIKIDKNCPCELSKHGVINIKNPTEPCKDYVFRLVAYFVKKE